MKEQHARVHIINILPSLPAEFTTREVLQALDLNYRESVSVVSGNLRALEKLGYIRMLRRGRRNQIRWTAKGERI